MPQCKHYDICDRDVEGDPAGGLCILHSTDPAKDTHAFAEALATHRGHKGDKFEYFIFPERADFSGATFSGEAVFRGATFNGRADFGGATFNGEADFDSATFNGETVLLGATFNGEALFYRATFRGEVYCDATFNERAVFLGAKFSKAVIFDRAMFNGIAFFHGAMFSEGANFDGATFNKEAHFDWTIFSGRTRFAGGQLGRADATGRIFANAEVDFTQVVIKPPDAVTFLEADLTKCRFQDTDLRKVQFVDVIWPQKHQRIVVYDEIAPVESGDGSTRPWPQIEHLYRELIEFRLN